MKDFELEEIIKQTVIESFKDLKPMEIGKVISIQDGLVRAYGLNNGFLNEIVVFSNGQRGLLISLEVSEVAIIVLGDFTTIKEGDEIKRTNKSFHIKVSNNLLGVALNGFGEGIEFEEEGIEYPVFNKPYPILERSPVNRPFLFGIGKIDCLIPVGKGQRQLIIGDRGTGKTSVALNAILSHKDDSNFVSIFVAIGKRPSAVRRIHNTLLEKGVNNFLLIVANNGDPVAMRYLSPYVGCAIGEYFMSSGKDVLVIYDDLTNHANSYREISLILKRPPGREAYPGDIFYIHSSLLERGAQLSQEKGGGSLTLLPIVETQNNDLSSYIATNIISITDGQIFLNSKLVAKGEYPAIDLGLSVSRVGSTAQPIVLKKVSSFLKLNISQSQDYEEFTQFSSDIEEETLKILQKGRLSKKALKQSLYEVIPPWQQALLVFAISNGILSSEKHLERYKEETKIYEKDSWRIMKGDIDFIEDICERIAQLCQG